MVGMVTTTPRRHRGDKTNEHLSSVKSARDSSKVGHRTLPRLTIHRQTTTTGRRVHLTTPRGPLQDRKLTAGTDTRIGREATIT